MNALRCLIKYSFVPVLVLLLVSCDYSNDKVKDLHGHWRFSVGDNMLWADPDYNDIDWDRIYVPAAWENQGYNGYNGYAWYRKKVRILKRAENVNLYLYLGRIDDVDEVFFNGKRIGSTGSFPPNYETAYSVQRKYYIPSDLIRYNEDNVIAVRVYDARESGGIREGRIGIYNREAIPVDLDLRGNWKFHTGDSLVRKEATYDDSGWKTIAVPSRWENQGYDNYDGFAWYRRKFDLPASLKDKKIVVLAGKIDDIDEVYINGVMVGHSGTFSPAIDKSEAARFWDEFRGYYLPDDVVLKDTDNLITVRVYDVGGDGGIYEGPVGLISQEKYMSYWRNHTRNRRFYYDE